jgi:pyruvyl transferase EpsO
MQETSAATIKRLQGVIHDNLADLVDLSGRYALLDFPNHYNIGDSAIWLGELAYFDRVKSKPSFVSEIPTHSDERMLAAIGDGQILLHGGGNFGDIWPGFREFREHILGKYQGRPVIQMPQTIHFKNQENVDSTARAIEKHGNYKLLVRDKKSFEFARKWFQCEVRLCPDMAFWIGPVKRLAPSHDLLLNLRADQEVGAAHDTSRAIARPNVIVADWPEHEEADFQKRTKRAAIIKGLLRGDVGGRAKMTELAYRERAQQRFDRGVRLLSSARQVITDRMHGHIMSLLLDADHCVLDNSYGKTSTFIDAWQTANGDRAALVANIDEALDVLDKRTALSRATTI